MAATEVRTVRHRTVNHSFVQEDAKRTPKFACCQSSRATSKFVSATDESAHNAVSVTHFNHKFAMSY